MFPTTKFIPADQYGVNVFNVLGNMRDKGYTKFVGLFGSDRKPVFEKMFEDNKKKLEIEIENKRVKRIKWNFRSTKNIIENRRKGNLNKFSMFKLISDRFATENDNDLEIKKRNKKAFGWLEERRAVLY